MLMASAPCETDCLHTEIERISRNGEILSGSAGAIGRVTRAQNAFRNRRVVRGEGAAHFREKGVKLSER
jgi:hypothetical protein